MQEIIKVMEQEYGRRVWLWMSQDEQMRVTAEFLYNYFEAIKVIKKIRQGERR